MEEHQNNNKRSNFFYRRYPKSSLTVFVSLAIVFLLLVIEILLRLSGQQAGKFRNDTDFKFVDSFHIRHNYIADKEGLFRVSEVTRQLIKTLIANGRWGSPGYNLETLDLEGTIAQVIADFTVMNQDSLNDHEFHRFVDSLKYEKNTPKNALDSAYQGYLQSPINADGFRSIPFRKYKVESPRVLLLGDSFTWGLTANPIVNSFADRLSARGFLCYNSGIIGADPAQYLATAQKFIPILEPDVVIVNFFMGNDQMNYQRTPRPFEPVWHTTNSTWLMAHPYGCYLEAQEAYDYNAYLHSIPIEGNRQANAWFAKTVLTTRLWEALRRFDMVSANYSRPCQDTFYVSPVSEVYLKEIDRICRQHHSGLILSLIPICQQSTAVFHREAKENFPAFQYHFPENINREDFNNDDQHFNNSGHKKYADFLEGLIEKELAKKAKR